MLFILKLLDGWMAEIYQPPLVPAYILGNHEISPDEQEDSYRASLMRHRTLEEIPQT